MFANTPCRRLRSVAFMLICLAAAGCKETLYSGLSENEANEMVAVLVASGFEPSRARDKDGIYEITLVEEDVAAAVTVLRNAGYPRQKFETLGEVFGAEGIFGSPFEQQTRFVHAMNQELSSTVSAISGVRAARVLVTSPPRGRYDREAPRATASVTIHHETAFDIGAHISSIKMIVAHSLPNLDYDDVAVVLFPAGGPVISANTAPVAGQTAMLGGENAEWLVQTAAMVPGLENLDTSRLERLVHVSIGAFLLIALLVLRRLFRGRPTARRPQ